MEKSKLINKEFKGEWKPGDGSTLYNQELTFENGIKGGVSTKEMTAINWAVGIEYEFDVEEKNGFKKIKLVKPANGFKAGSTFNPDAQLKVAACNAVSDLIIAGKIPIGEIKQQIQGLFTFLKGMQ